jgi:hypothetical protein
MLQGKVALEEHVVLPSMSAAGAVGSAAAAARLRGEAAGN